MTFYKYNSKLKPLYFSYDACDGTLEEIFNQVSRHYKTFEYFIIAKSNRRIGSEEAVHHLIFFVSEYKPNSVFGYKRKDGSFIFASIRYAESDYSFDVAVYEMVINSESYITNFPPMSYFQSLRLYYWYIYNKFVAPYYQKYRR
jgi:hypothetical protein